MDNVSNNSARDTVLSNIGDDEIEAYLSPCSPVSPIHLIDNMSMEERTFEIETLMNCIHDYFIFMITECIQNSIPPTGTRSNDKINQIYVIYQGYLIL